MNRRWRCSSFLLILAVGSCATTAEIVKNNAEAPITTNNGAVGQGQGVKGDTAKLEYETALRPALLQKRSIANIARLLLGGNVPPNHPLVKYPEPKAWNLASNIVASLPAAAAAASTLSAAASAPYGWPAKQNTALENIQQLFETKAKIIPYTGQVATGLTGLASVKGDLLRQIHSISTQAIAQAAAEAAARALAGAAAAHAVTNSIHSVVNPAQTGIKGGWSSYQNSYANPPGPGDQPGPPYHSSSAHIDHYQAPPSSYPYQSTPSPLNSPTLPSPVDYPQGPHSHQPYQNGYYTLYNTVNSPGQTPYTPAPPMGHARPTLSPSTLVATTPSGYNLLPSSSLSSNPNIQETSIKLTPIELLSSNDTSINVKDRYGNGRSFFRLSPPVIVVSSGSNNASLNSFRRTAPIGIFGRHAPQSSATSSLLSTISSLLSASTAAYNAAFTPPGSPHFPQQRQQSSAIFSNLLSSSSPNGPRPAAAAPSLHGPTPAESSLLSSAANAGSFNNEYGRQSINALPPGSGNYGSSASSGVPSFLHNSAPNPYGIQSQTNPSPVHPSGYPFNQHAASNVGANYAQPGTNPYASHGIQSSSHFGSNHGASQLSSPGGIPSTGSGIPSAYHPSTGGPVSNVGSPTISYSNGGFPNAGPIINGPGYPAGATGPSPGHVSGWNTQHAGPSASPSTWHSSSSNVYPPGYPRQTSGNFNNPSGSFGGGSGGQPAQFQITSGSTLPQQAYPSISQNAYQSSTINAYAQAQPSSPPSSLFYSSSSQQQQQSPFSTAYGTGGIGNPSINARYDSNVDLSQSASNMGNNDYEDIEDNSHNPTPSSPRKSHHSHQPTQQQRRNRPSKNNNASTRNSYSGSSSGGEGRYPSPGKKRPSHHHHQSKKTSQLYSAHANIMKNNNFRSNINKNNGGKRVIPTGDKKGSQFDSSSLVDVVDSAYNDDDDDARAYMNHSEEYPLNNKNRWRSKNPSGQRPNSFYNHDSNGGWRGKKTESKQTSSANVRGNGPKRVRPQSGQAARIPSKNHRNKKVSYGAIRDSPSSSKSSKKKTIPKTKFEEEPTYFHGGAGGIDQQQQQSGAVQYKSRDVYTTLPEYVFRKGERPDVFVRPSRKRKHGGGSGGQLRPRLGQTYGTSSSSSSSSHSKTQKGFPSHPKTISKKTSSSRKESATKAPSYHDDEEEDTSSSSNTSEEMEKSHNAPTRGKIFKSVANGREDEEFINVSEAVDETARAEDVIGTNNEFITASEEFDPEEREAFVDDIYEEDHHHHNLEQEQPPSSNPHRRQDYYGVGGGDEDEIDTEDENKNEHNDDKVLSEESFLAEDNDNDESFVDKK